MISNTTSNTSTQSNAVNTSVNNAAKNVNNENKKSNVLDLLNDDNAEVKGTTNNIADNFNKNKLSGTANTSLNNAYKNITEYQTVDNTFNIGSNGSKFDDNTKFIGADNVSVDSVFSTNNNDSVFGTGSYSANQGDYNTSKETKTNVKTNTFGKQDNIGVTSKSITENKGNVDSQVFDAVESVFKDKEGQEVLDSKKKRTKTEENDVSNKLRDKIKSVNNNTKIDEKAAEQFQVGDDEYDRAANKKIQELNDKAKELESKVNSIKTKLSDLENKESEYNHFIDKGMSYKEEWESKRASSVEIVNDLKLSVMALANNNPINKKIYENSKDFKEMKNNIKDVADSYNIDLGDISKAKIDDFVDICEKVEKGVDSFFDEKISNLDEKISNVNQELDVVKNEKTATEKAYDKAKNEADKYRNNLDSKINETKSYSNKLRNEVARIQQEYEDGTLDSNKAFDQLRELGLMFGYSGFGFSASDLVYLAGGLDGKYLAANPSSLGSYVGKETPTEETLLSEATPETTTVEGQPAIKETVTEIEKTPKSVAQTSIDDARTSIANSANTEEAAVANEMLDKVEESQNKVTTALDAINQAGGMDNATPELIAAYVEAQKEYNDNLEKALNQSSSWKQVDFNTEFTKSIVNAKDFDITLPDGSKQSYSNFATEMATKSPQIAAAMYEAKAQKYEDEKHPVLAKIERNKAEMMSKPGFWAGLGRAFLGADNQVRDQFVKMANTNMRATYATYNNVLNDPNATPEQKEEARTQIQQANILMGASTALEASTGVLTGIGDSQADGVYGTTNAGDLNDWQKFAAGFTSSIKAFMGFAVTPAANEAYQKMYYLNQDDKGFFSQDFDGDGFTLAQEYGNSATAQLVGAGVQLSAGVAMCFSPSTVADGINLIVQSANTAYNGLYGVRNSAKDTQLATETVLEYFKEADELNGLPEEAKEVITQAIEDLSGTNVTENFELKSEEVNNIDNWLEGSGSNTASNNKFNQSLSYEDWLKLIENDEMLQEYAKTLNEKENKAEEKDVKEDNVDQGVNA